MTRRAKTIQVGSTSEGVKTTKIAPDLRKGRIKSLLAVKVAVTLRSRKKRKSRNLKSTRMVIKRSEIEEEDFQTLLRRSRKFSRTGKTIAICFISKHWTIPKVKKLAKR